MSHTLTVGYADFQMANTIRETFRQRLVQLMIERDMTPADLARRADRSRP